MKRPSDLLAEHAAAFAQRVAELAWAGDSASLSEVASGSSDADVLALIGEIGNLVNLADAVAADISGVVAARSARGGEEPLAKRLGEKSAAAAVAATAGVPVGRAGDWCRVGQALAPRRTLTGDPLPLLHPAVAAAFDAGQLSLEAARLVLDTLTTLSPRLSLEELQARERFLVEEAQHLPTPYLARLCRRLIEQDDPDGTEPREEALREKAGVRRIRRRDGMIRYIFDAEPEGAGFFDAALDARTAPRREVHFSTEGDEDEADPVVEDTRTLSQKRYDALVGIFRDALKRDPGDMSGTAVTMLVTVAHETLLTGIGTATIFGGEHTLSAAAARRLACSAKIIPIVLDGESQPLDLGAGKRLFTENQRYAMAVRDGGCSWPGCTEPPGRCEAAHIRAWQHFGETNLDNGVLLCPFHHRRFDNDGWGFEWRNRVPYFIPPASLDASRTPRRGGRKPPDHLAG